MDPGTTGNCFGPGLPLLTHFHFISSPPALSYVRSTLYLLEFPANLVITGSLQKSTVITKLHQNGLLAQITLTLPQLGSLWEADRVWHSSLEPALCGTGSPSPPWHGTGTQAPGTEAGVRQTEKHSALPRELSKAEVGNLSALWSIFHPMWKMEFRGSTL